MLKQANIEDKTIVAVVSSQLACKGALIAGASVVVPDEQNFKILWFKVHLR